MSISTKEHRRDIAYFLSNKAKNLRKQHQAISLSAEKLRMKYSNIYNMRSRFGSLDDSVAKIDRKIVYPLQFAVILN